MSIDVMDEVKRLAGEMDECRQRIRTATDQIIANDGKLTPGSLDLLWCAEAGAGAAFERMQNLLMHIDTELGAEHERADRNV